MESKDLIAVVAHEYGADGLMDWWAQQDSNLRLPPCEGGTLPLSYAPIAQDNNALCSETKNITVSQCASKRQERFIFERPLSLKRRSCAFSKMRAYVPVVSTAITSTRSELLR